MKLIGSFLIAAVLVIAGILVWAMIVENYQWDNQYLSYWTLSVKASTLEQKSEYLDKFVQTLQESNLQGSNDALLYKTPDNSFDQNFVALKSLQTRMHELKSMDPNSFQYNTAIQQITAQEQDGAGPMIDVFKGTWEKVHWYFLWNPWIALLEIIGIIACFVFGSVLIAIGME